MMDIVKIVHSDESVDLRELKGDRCLVELGEQRIVLSYDAAFDFALKLSAFLRDVEEREDHGFAVGEHMS